MLGLQRILGQRLESVSMLGFVSGCLAWLRVLSAGKMRLILWPAVAARQWETSKVSSRNSSRLLVTSTAPAGYIYCTTHNGQLLPLRLSLFHTSQRLPRPVRCRPSVTSHARHHPSDDPCSIISSQKGRPRRRLRAHSTLMILVVGRNSWRISSHSGRSRAHFLHVISCKSLGIDP